MSARTHYDHHRNNKYIEEQNVSVDQSLNGMDADDESVCSKIVLPKGLGKQRASFIKQASERNIARKSVRMSRPV